MVPSLAHQPLLLKFTFLEKQFKYLSFFKYADSLSLLTFGRSAALKQVLSLPWLDLTPGDAAAELPASPLISWLLCLTQQAEQDEFSPLFITLLQCRLFTFSSFKISWSYWVIQTEVTHCTKPVTSLIYVLISTSVRFGEIFFSTLHVICDAEKWIFLLCSVLCNSITRRWALHQSYGMACGCSCTCSATWLCM